MYTVTVRGLNTVSTGVARDLDEVAYYKHTELTEIKLHLGSDAEAETHACMLKASILSLKGAEKEARDQAISDFGGDVEEYEHREKCDFLWNKIHHQKRSLELLSLGEYLTKEEITEGIDVVMTQLSKLTEEELELELSQYGDRINLEHRKVCDHLWSKAKEKVEAKLQK